MPINIIKKIYINNPFRLKEKNLLIRLYCAWEPRFITSIFRPFHYLQYALFLTGRLYGYKRLLKNKYSLLRAETSKGQSFHIRDTNSQFHSIYFKDFIECYEPDVSGVIELFLSPGDTFIDIGSNWGHHSFVAALNKKAKVILFEPNPNVCEDALRITKELGLESSVILHNLALSNKQGSLTLTQNYFESGIASISKSFITKKIFNNKYDQLIKKIFNLRPISYSVPVQQLDYFSLNKADLIKIDAEGVELEVLQGALSTIKKLRPLIIFEFFPSNSNEFVNFKSFFATVSYTAYTIKCDRDFSGNYLFRLSDIDEKNTNFVPQSNLLAFPNEKNIEVLMDDKV